MPLQRGEHLGPYEVIALLGAGAMGEVYRARDPRLGRELAVKILTAEFSKDQEKLARFEHEARAASALNHPNLVAVYEVGQFDDTRFLAMELVEGSTLRDLLRRGPLPLAKVVDYGGQIASGLAAAHARGLVHRDLKPQNIMVTRDGLIKILDFGLAKLTTFVSGTPTDSTEASPPPGTEPGTILGTVGYMAPEQARGQPVDFRADQFAFGAILYEMASGRRAFQRATPIETLSAILREQPEPLGEIDVRARPTFDWVLSRCLAKDPAERYGSTRDLARDLKDLHDHLCHSAALPRAAAPSRRGARAGRRAAVAAVLIGALALGAGLLLGRRLVRTSPPLFRQITFGRGTVWSARFAQEGQTVVYGAAWDGNPFRLFSVRPESTESLGLPFPDANLMSISRSGQVLASAHCRSVAPGGMTTGMLVEAPLEGGTPREIQDGVLFADWAPGGDIAMVLSVSGRSVLEFPRGLKLYETTGFISHPRVSQSGDIVAFLDHPSQTDDSGAVAVVDRAGRKRSLTGSWASVEGLAWYPGRREVWFAATAERESRAIYAVNMAGRRRLIARIAGNLTLQDIAPDGRLLVTRENRQIGILGRRAGDAIERDLSWLDSALVTDISSDGNEILFTEFGESVDSSYAGFLRRMDRSPPKRLGAGFAMALSPDRQRVLSIVPAMPPKVLLLPTGPGQPRLLPLGSLIAQRADWFPDGRRVLIAASEAGHGVRIHVLETGSGKIRALTPEGMPLTHYQGFPVSPDEKWLAALAPEGRLTLYPIDGGTPRPIPDLDPDAVPIRWSVDGRSLLVAWLAQMPVRIFRVDPWTGEKVLWKELPLPSDPAGIRGFPAIQVTADGSAYAYSFARFLSELYVVEGLK